MWETESELGNNARGNYKTRGCKDGGKETLIKWLRETEATVASGR